MRFEMDLEDVALIDSLAKECRLTRAKMLRWMVLKVLRPNPLTTEDGVV